MWSGKLRQESARTWGGPGSSPRHPRFPQRRSAPFPGAPTGLLQVPGSSWVVLMAAAAGAGGGGWGERGRASCGQMLPHREGVHDARRGWKRDHS